MVGGEDCCAGDALVAGKFFFVVLSVAIGVAALTGVRGFSASFRRTLLTRARSIMAGDLSARMFQQPTPEEQQNWMRWQLKGRTGVRRDAGDGDCCRWRSVTAIWIPLLVSLKAVDPAKYPFYGEVELAPAGKIERRC